MCKYFLYISIFYILFIYRTTFPQKMPMLKLKYLNTINGLKNITINPSTSAEMIATLHVVVQYNIQDVIPIHINCSLINKRC